MIKLRPYQEKAKAAICGALRTGDASPCVVIPAGGGNTPVIASIAVDDATSWYCRALILAPSDNAAMQIFHKLRAICPEEPIGTYLAGQWRIDTDDRTIVTSIESVSGQSNGLDAFDFDVVILVKSHLIEPYLDQAYHQFLATLREVNPGLKVIGFAAMSHRLMRGTTSTTEPICSPDRYLNHVCHEVGIRDLIDAGFLTPVVTKSAVHQIDTEMLPLFGGDFDHCAAGDLIDRPEMIQAACAEIVDRTRDRNSVLIFPPVGGIPRMSVVHGLHKYHGIRAGAVTHVTGGAERSELAAKFRSGELKYLVSDDLPAAGFEAANVDSVVLLQPTLSAKLYGYMAGQGLRPHPGKKSYLVLDFVGNALRHGPVDQIAAGMPSGRTGVHLPILECALCHTVVTGDCASCPDCGGELRPPKYRRRAVSASESGAASAAGTTTEHAVRDTKYGVHAKRGAPAGAPKSMRVDYLVGNNRWQSEFICFEHSGYARQKAVHWWRERSFESVPTTADRAVEIATNGGVAHTARITVQNVAGQRYDRVVGYELVIPPMSVRLAITSDGEEISSNAGQPT